MNDATAEDHAALIVELIARQLGAPIERITPATFLVDDLRADLLGLTQLALALEDELDIEIPDAEWINMATVAEVIEYVSMLIDRKRTGADRGGAGG